MASGKGQNRASSQRGQNVPERKGRAGVTGEGYAMSASGRAADSPKKQGDKLGPGKGTAARKR